MHCFQNNFQKIFITFPFKCLSLIRFFLAESTPGELTGIQGSRWTIDDSKLCVDLPKHFSPNTFDQTQINMLTAMYAALYKVPISSLISTSIFQYYSSAKLNAILFGIHASQTVSSSVAMAVWDTHLFGSSSSMPLLLLLLLLLLCFTTQMTRIKSISI